MAKIKAKKKVLFIPGGGKGAKTLGSKANVSNSDFQGGVTSTKKTNKIATGKNSANAAKSAKKRSFKVGKQGITTKNDVAGKAALSNKTKGPSGIKSKKGRLK